jgi:hypothetical protein
LLFRSLHRFSHPLKRESASSAARVPRGGMPAPCSTRFRVICARRWSRFPAVSRR